MKDKLISLIIALPLIITGLAGCTNTPIVKEEKPLPKIEEKYSPPKKIKDNRVMLAQSNYSHFCDCEGIFNKLTQTEKYIILIDRAKNYSLKELQKHPENLLYERDLYVLLDLKERLIQTREDLIEEAKECKCGREDL